MRYTSTDHLSRSYLKSHSLVKQSWALHGLKGKATILQISQYDMGQ
jgi:hypothetical protein